MAKVPIGTEVAQVVVFNSGFLTIDGELMTDVENVTITNSFDVKSYRSLNSIKKRALRRATLEQSVKATIKGLTKGVYQKWFSSSSPVTDGTEYTVLDGQQVVAAVYLTCRVDDDSDKEFQFKLVNPIFGGFNLDLATEDYAGHEIDIMCTEIVMTADTLAEN